MLYASGAAGREQLCVAVEQRSLTWAEIPTDFEAAGEVGSVMVVVAVRLLLLVGIHLFFLFWNWTLNSLYSID
jgi:hypothetical protein